MTTIAQSGLLITSCWESTSGATTPKLESSKKNGWVFEEGDDKAIVATRLGWYDGHEPKELLDQIVIAIFRPADDGETLFELQSIFHPTAESIEFQQTNFGFLAVRVARSISEHFGAGKLTNSEGLGRRKRRCRKNRISSANRRGGWTTAGRCYLAKMAQKTPRTSSKASPILIIRLTWDSLIAGTCGKTGGWEHHPVWMARLKRPEPARCGCVSCFTPTEAQLIPHKPTQSPNGFPTGPIST